MCERGQLGRNELSIPRCAPSATEFDDQFALFITLLAARLRKTILLLTGGPTGPKHRFALRLAPRVASHTTAALPASPRRAGKFYGLLQRVGDDERSRDVILLPRVVKMGGRRR